MRAPNKTFVRFAAVAMLGSIAAACATVQPAPPAPVVRAEPTPAQAPTPRFHSMQQYEYVLAQRIFESNRGHTITGKLQPLPRAVVVLHFQVDASGKVHNVQTWRTPEREADHLARASLTRAGALPAPPRQWLREGRLGITETWLFNSDGRFHLRALKPRQG